MNFAAVIFDMDGLLIDSEGYWIEADKEFFRRRDIEPTEDVVKFWKRKLMGQSIKEGSLKLIKGLGLPDSLEGVINERKELTDKIYKDWTKPMPGANSLITKLREKGQKQAVASGSDMYRIEMVMERFGWHKKFDDLVSSGVEGIKSKPAPDIYLHTAKILGVEPSSCVVLEDAENGITAAKDAGMACISIPSADVDSTRADLTVDSLENMKVYSFLGI